MNREQRMWADAVDHHGMIPDELADRFEANNIHLMPPPNLGDIAAGQVAELDLDAEYEAHCQPNGD